MVHDLVHNGHWEQIKLFIVLIKPPEVLSEQSCVCFPACLFIHVFILPGHKENEQSWESVAEATQPWVVLLPLGI